jgi:hypothetical protein
MAGLTCEVFPEAGLLLGPHPAAPPQRLAAAVASADAAVLLNILRPEVNLAIWRRHLPGSLTNAVKPLCDMAPFAGVAEDTPEAALDALVATMPTAVPSSLLIDIERLAITFVAIARTGGAVRLRLEAITGPACRRWHADAVGLRLLCTYRGAGTEWVPMAGGATAARRLVADALPSSPRRIATGAVAILKGEGFVGNAGFGCIHRSPPAGPGRRTRLLLCIDEPGRIPLG